jgi:hypothetical protein
MAVFGSASPLCASDPVYVGEIREFLIVGMFWVLPGPRKFLVQTRVNINYGNETNIQSQKALTAENAPAQVIESPFTE